MEQKYRIGNDYGYIMWDIERIIMDREKFAMREFEVEALTTDNYFNGDAEYAMSTDTEEPLIVVNLTSDIDKLIDGNHRLWKAKKLGIKKVLAYYLSFEEHKKYIVEYDEKMYWDVVQHWER